MNLQLSQAQAIEFNGKQYFVASMPDAGDGEHYVLWVQAVDNPLLLTSSGVIAKPDVSGVWKRRGLVGGMAPQGSDDEFVEASESMPVRPYTAGELSYMRREIHFTANPNPAGSYIRANNGKYPLRDYQGRPIRIRSLEKQVIQDSGAHYTSAQIKPYIQFEGYEQVGARYEAQLQLRTFTEQDVKVPGEKALIGQSMVVANRRIAKGEIVGVYGGTVLPFGIFGPGEQTYTMKVGSQMVAHGNTLVEEPIHISGTTSCRESTPTLSTTPTAHPCARRWEATTLRPWLSTSRPTCGWAWGLTRRSSASHFYSMPFSLPKISPLAPSCVWTTSTPKT